MKKLLLAAATLAIAFSSTHSFAQDVPLLSETVAYGDLNLISASGRRVLGQRIDRAVRRVCPGSYSDYIQARLAARRCIRETAAAVGGQVALAIARAQGHASAEQLAAR